MKPTSASEASALATARAALRFLGWVELAAAIGALVVICCLTGAAIILRYGFDSSLLWGEEVSLLLMKVMIFCGAAAIYKGRAYICVGFVFDAAPVAVQNLFSILIWIATTLFAAVIVWQSVLLYPTQINVRTYLLELPKFVFTVPLLYGAASIFLTSLYYTIYTAVSARRPSDDKSASARDQNDSPGTWRARMTILTLFIVFLGLFAMRASVTTAMGVGCLAALLVGDYPLSQIPRYMTSGIESFVLLAVPFFILVGNLLNAGGASERIFDFSKSLFGRIPGSLAQVNIGASMIFAGMSGAALADVAGLGTIEMKVMRESGYRPFFAAAVTLASSMIGPIIPPSIVMVVYSAATGVSTGRLFLAGIVPGVMTGILLMVYVYYLARTGRERCPMAEEFSLRKVVYTGRRAFFALLAPVIVLGGMVTGIFTPTEAGLAAAFYALLLGILYTNFAGGRIVTAFRQTAVDSASILYLISISAVMGWIVTIEGTAQDLVGMVSFFGDNKYLGLIAINVFLLLLGCIIETTAAILICGSLLLPAAQSMGVDPVHFGIVLCFNLLVGMMTPPMGVGLYVISSVGGVKPEAVIRSILPFFIPLLAALAIITFVPELTLWLPRLVFGT